jgi:hypothetical protein
MQTQKLAALAAILGAAAALALPANAQETFTLQTINSTGTNTSQGAAQMLDLSDATNAPLFGAALTAFNAKNSDTVRQNATSFTPGGQLVSPQFFPFGGPSVPVNANVAAVGHLTAPGTAGATNYFGFAEAAGGQIGVVGTATAPPNQGTELFLYDNASNLVALATGNVDGLSSRIDFTVPDGSGGIWQAAITQGVDFTSPIDYRLQFQMPYSALSTFTTNVIGSGQEKSGSLGTYDVNANVGDNLHFDVNATTPLTGTELLLSDPNGNLVALASQNGSDGFSSIIDFTVPIGDAGEWQIQVAPDANASPPHPYAYDLVIQGFSGLGPVNPSPVPEPSTWAMAFVGFAGLGLVGFRRAGRAQARPLSTSVRL